MCPFDWQSAKIRRTAPRKYTQKTPVDSMVGESLIVAGPLAIVPLLVAFALKLKLLWQNRVRVPTIFILGELAFAILERKDREYPYMIVLHSLGVGRC